MLVVKPIISASTMALIVEFVNSINHGTITFTVQDGRLLQLERNDKIRLDALGQGGKSHLLNPDQAQRLQKRLQEELQNMRFGQLLLHIKGGLIAQIERMEKQRYFGLEGIYGDGI